MKIAHLFGGPRAGEAVELAANTAAPEYLTLPASRRAQLWGQPPDLELTFEICRYERTRLFRAPDGVLHVSYREIPA